MNEYFLDITFISEVANDQPRVAYRLTVTKEEVIKHDRLKSFLP